jgi:hypothetical protein
MTVRGGFTAPRHRLAVQPATACRVTFQPPGSPAGSSDLALPRALRRLDAFDVIILDDLGYVQQSAEEVEVLFTLMDRFTPTRLGPPAGVVQVQQ